MLKKILLFILISFPLSIFTISNSSLKKTNWYTENGNIGYSLDFTGKNEFNITLQFEGGGSLYGTYQVKGNKIHLKIKHKGNWRIKVPKTCIYKKIPRSAFANDFISCGSEKDLRFWKKNSIQEGGKKAVVNGIKVIAFNAKSMKAKSAVSMRSAPNLKAKKQKFTITLEKDKIGYMGYYNGKKKTVMYLPKGETVQVYARTVTKIKVLKWNNFWYYCKVKDIDDHSGGRMVWIFGEFLKVK